MKAPLKTGILCVAVSCSAMANAMDNDTCSLMNEDNYAQFMEKANDVKVRNPFKPDNCVLMNYGRKDTADVDASYFNGNEQIEGIYEKFQRNRHTRVEMTFDNKSGTLYSFMQFDITEPSIEGFRDRNRDGTLEMFFDEFIFLHELMHLEPKVTRNQLYNMQQKEVYADIAAVVMLGAKHDMDVSQLHELLETVKNIRLADDMREKKRQRRTDRREVGNHGHYHEGSFNNALDYLAYLRDNSIDLRIESLQEASALTTYMMRNGNKSDSLIDFENKVASIQNDPNRKMFYDLPHSQQMGVYDYFKGEIIARLENWFEAPEEMLPQQLEKLSMVAPEVIEDAMNNFMPEAKVNAQQFLNNAFMTRADEVSVSMTMANEPKPEIDVKGLSPGR